MKKFFFICSMLLWFSSIDAQTLNGPHGRWEWDGRVVKNSNNWSIKWEYDGRYIKNSNNWSNKWEWDGRYLKNSNNWSEKWEWDGRYLKNSNNWSQKYELPSGAPVPVWAVVYEIINQQIFQINIKMLAQSV